MTSSAAEDLAETLVELAGAMSGGFDLDGFMTLLVDRCVSVLEVAAAGVLISGHGVAASRESLTPALRHEATPLVDSCADAAPVAVADLGSVSRWPVFVADVRREGFTSVYVVPLCRQGEAMGALALFREGGGPGGGRLARAVADVAAVVVSQARALRRAEELSRQLQHALDSRVVIEQAKGVLAERFGVGTGAAFAAIRGYARSHNQRVSELASSIVDGGFDTDLLRG